MFNTIGQAFLNQANLFYNDKSHLFDKLIPEDTCKQIVGCQDI